MFSNHQEMKFSAIVFVLCTWHLLSARKKKKIDCLFLFFCTFLFLSDYQCVVNSLLQALFCHNPFRIKKLKKKNNTI